MNNEIILNSGYTATVKYQIKVRSISFEISDKNYPNFCDWLRSKASELGTGKHFESYFGVDGDCDIEVLFQVSASYAGI